MGGDGAFAVLPIVLYSVAGGVYPVTRSRRLRMLCEVCVPIKDATVGIESISVTVLGMRTPQHLAANLQYYSAKPLSHEEKRELLAH